MEDYQFVRGTASLVSVIQMLSIETFSETFGDQNHAADLALFLKKAYATEKLLRELADSDTFFYLLYVGEEAVGYLKLNVDSAQSDIHDPAALEVERIYMKRAYQGRGLGHLLMNKAIEIANDLEKCYLWLGVWEKNEHALGYYRHYDFYQIGMHDFVVGNDVQTDLLMRKDLA
ncbi:GNAT family N-acetyltransferase [Fusibacter paucivorans]|uniref:GNAT family N-acetyltransferase n=1 Tax=Fusibacter paucivorans TaxID=76009 RepID=A0ABS5PQ91_9FIRM|nr:GNAT family N-acetyltransferase [Fusibacter paucivorans]MBS7526202.1 GNAT family N-acetyltransferase [Fusibacter paucivorans]